MSFLHFFRLCSRKVLPEKLYLKVLYFTFYGRYLRFDNPCKFSEKIFCLKIINGKKFGELMTRCYDKYTVREYVTEKLGIEQSSKILNELYDVYDCAEEIDFNKLPSRFVLKVTQSSGYNVICPDKTKLNINDTIKKLNNWLHIANSNASKKEENYNYNGHAKIICEKYIEEKNGNVPPDIRAYCFNGEPRLFVCDFGTTDTKGRHGHNIKRNVYNTNWELLDVNLGRPHDSSIKMPRPENLDDIINVVKKLSEDFFFVRVDIYNVEGKIIFGELTWIPMGGLCEIRPKRYDYILGSWLKIPKI